MITLRRTQDQHSHDILRDGKHIGYMQCHKERNPRIVLISAFGFIDLADMEKLTQELISEWEGMTGHTWSSIYTK